MIEVTQRKIDDSNPYGQGVKAAVDGKYISDCPYSEGSKDYGQWRNGWWAETMTILNTTATNYYGDDL